MKTKVNKFPISNHTGLKLGIRTLRGYLKLTCECEFHILPNKSYCRKESCEKFMKVRPTLVRHLLRNRLFNTYSMKQPDLYYFETIKMTSQA